ncbi:MAG: DUF4174 domain-containing protein [Cognatishimia sp.]|uniref:DUF4174 domain-containing protein n=1 Tax=Cognatishimia sp. 1_MG-2023 TaxID=3062642 RepID=UPI0026E44BBA|nr:DUF4174 domain-containing protein [Cognatishimia sp. 1_MG-2023]MDO6726718.1 DUF4174 domain-containing protein [Cognatishimia sp. 1_MG-2023]
MKRFCLALVLPIFIGPALAAEEQVETAEPPLIIDGETADISEYLWINRPVIVFSDSPADPRYVQQLELLNALPDDLRDRDVIVLTDANPEGKSALRKKLRPRGFMMVLMSKDGTVYLRKPFPWSVREISRSIDKLPSRQQEVRDRRETVTQ